MASFGLGVFIGFLVTILLVGIGFLIYFGVTTQWTFQLDHASSPNESNAQANVSAVNNRVRNAPANAAPSNAAANNAAPANAAASNAPANNARTNANTLPSAAV